jgi:hypothetical protein
LADLKEREHFEGLGVDWRTMIKYIWKKQDGKVWSGFFRLRIRTSGYF